MDQSIFLAKIIGPCLVLAALSFLLNRQNYGNVAAGILENAGVRYISGLLALVFGLLVVNTHNVWEASWTGIITVLGWLALVKGFSFFFFPDRLGNIVKLYENNKSLLKVMLTIMLLAGVLLTIKGYCLMMCPVKY